MGKLTPDHLSQFQGGLKQVPQRVAYFKPVFIVLIRVRRFTSQLTGRSGFRNK